MSFHSNYIIHIHRLTLRVSDVMLSAQFYHQLLGLNIIELSPTKATLSTGDDPILYLSKAKRVKQLDTAGLYHVAFLLESEAHLASWLHHQMLQKTIVIGASDHLVSKAIYFEDPDGNGIEVYCDTNPNNWVWSGDQIKMTTEPLDIEHLLSQATFPWNSKEHKVKIGHVHLSVVHLKNSEQFYHALGFKTMLDMRSALFLSNQGYHHHLAINSWGMQYGKMHQIDDVNLDCMEVSYPDEETRNEAIMMLEKNGFLYTQMNDETMAYDPSGIPVYLYAPTKKSHY